jgi:hypothetical protein
MANNTDPSPDRTQWTCGVDSGKAWLKVSINGGAATPIVLKGACYSPAPMNGSNKFGPAIGDWFWDDFTVNGTTITGWDALWARDIPSIQGLKANSIRVYCMLSRQLTSDGKFPSPWNGGHLFSHNQFLDHGCWGGSPVGTNALWVLVGIPLPDQMFWQDQWDPGSQLTEFWTNVLQETAADLGQHPAVMGFTIQNELDGSGMYDQSPGAAFWWSQAEKWAKIVKDAAPGKLVGMAVHDAPPIPDQAGAKYGYMAQCTHIDFWGVNTYQTANFDSIFNGNSDYPIGYSGLTGTALKPVIITEWGLPATGHRDPNDFSTIYEDATTRANTAKYIAGVLPNAFQQPLCLGAYYFEFCDEWWNQPDPDNTHRNNICTWYGGTPDGGFPNGYWDQKGFGLYSISRGNGPDHNCDNIWGDNGPAMPIDVHTERTELTTQVRNAFSASR